MDTLVTLLFTGKEKKKSVKEDAPDKMEVNSGPRGVASFDWLRVNLAENAALTEIYPQLQVLFSIKNCHFEPIFATSVTQF